MLQVATVGSMILVSWDTTPTFYIDPLAQRETAQLSVDEPSLKQNHFKLASLFSCKAVRCEWKEVSVCP